MSRSRVVGISAGGSATWDELGRIVGCILDGARGAGSQTEHFLLAYEDVRGADAPDDRCHIVSGPDGMRALLDEVTAADHFVLGLAGSLGSPESPIGRFIDACYKNAKWLSLGDLVLSDGLEVQLAPGADPGAVRFCAPLRPLTEEHRGLVVLHPPRAIPDHDDPFCDNTFFVLEEMQRLLGFMPSGRVLSTGLYDPPLDQNPILQRQALQMGRRLVLDAVSPGARK